jgi:hypothetical protein
VPKTFEVEHYTQVIELVIITLIIALCFPNAQQLLAAYEPALEPTQRRGWFRLKLGLSSGLFLGGTLFWVVRSFYVAAPSPFLYFNF